MKKWLIEHLDKPYLKKHDKQQLSLASGLTKKQVQVWFINIRKVSKHGRFKDCELFGEQSVKSITYPLLY
jgi:hypothetical protein